MDFDFAELGFGNQEEIVIVKKTIALLSPFPSSVGEKNAKRWQTPYGVSFEQTGLGDFWMYTYDEDLPDVEPSARSGCLSALDIQRALEQLAADPDKLRRKPESIRLLEQLTGSKARRKYNAFGKWHLSKTQEFSLFNNPFGLSLGYTRSEDEFEIWLLRAENEPRERVALDEVKALLRQHGYSQ